MARPVICSKCGASSKDGATFYVITPYRAAGTHELESVGPDGTLITIGLDPGVPTYFYQAEIECQGCGHQWITKREWQ